MTLSEKYDLNFAFNLRRTYVNRTADKLMGEGLLPSPNNDVVKAIIDNMQTEEDLRNYFKNK